MAQAPNDDMHADGFSFPRLTPAIKQLLLLNLLVFVANALLLGRLSGPSSEQGAWFAFSWDKAWEGFGLGWLRLLTYQFTHSFADPWHLLMNGLMLYFFGTMAEARLGYRGTWLVYVLSGIAGALLHLVLASLQGMSDVPLVGASGACYGMLLYAAALAPHASVILFIVRIPLWLLAGILVFLGLYATFIEFATGHTGGVAHGAHLGGASFGYLAFVRNWCVDYVPYERQGSLWQQVVQAWQRRRAHAAAAAQRDNEATLDQILAKVKAQGLAALTPAERKFLERQSQDRRKP